MSRAFVPMFVDDWPAMAEVMPAVWPEAAAGMDLRWFANESRMGRQGRPGRAGLCRRWGWTDHKVRCFLRGGTWEDPLFSSETPADLQPISSETPAPVRVNLDNEPENSSESPAKLQPISSETPHARLVNNLTTEQRTTEQDYGTYINKHLHVLNLLDINEMQFGRDVIPIFS